MHSAQTRRRGLPPVDAVAAAMLLAAGMCVVAPQVASADGVGDCTSAATGYGLKGPDAGDACSRAQGGDNSDCISAMRDAAGSSATYESASYTWLLPTAAEGGP